MRRRDLGLLMLAPALLTESCRPSATKPARLVIATGSPAGVYDRLGLALATAARRAGVPATTLNTAASIANLELIRSRAADIAFTTVDCAELAIDATPPFHTPVPVAALAALYQDELQLVVRAGSGIRDVAGLAGRRVSTGAAGSGTEIVARRALTAAGIAAKTTETGGSLSDAAAGLRAGRLDGFFFSGGIPTPAIRELATGLRGGIRLVPLGDLAGPLQRRYGEVYQERTIPATAYRTAADTGTIGTPNILVARSDMPDAAARWVTALLFRAKPDLVTAHVEADGIDRRSALGTYPVPLHPGASAYYRSSKVFSSR
jgi:TRAP transporter TAXI family solute receptor